MISQQEWISQMEEITGSNGWISHREWRDEVIAQHDLNKPFAPENGEALKFKAGDAVIYTNSNDVTFRRRVTSLYCPDFRCSLYARGARYLIDSDSPWVPVSESSLRLLDEDNAHASGG